MKKILFIILIVLLAVWFLVFAIDMVSFLIGPRPLLMLQIPGGDMSLYVGLGYWIEIDYPLTTIDDPVQSSYSINVIPYIVINVVIIAILTIIRPRRR